MPKDDHEFMLHDNCQPRSEAEGVFQPGAVRLSPTPSARNTRALPPLQTCGMHESRCQGARSIQAQLNQIHSLLRDLQSGSILDSLNLLHNTQVTARADIQSQLHHFHAELRSYRQDSEQRFRAIENMVYDTISLLQDAIQSFASRDETTPSGSGTADPEELALSASTIEEASLQTMAFGKATFTSRNSTRDQL